MRHMPVLRDGELAGIIKIGDVVKYRLDDLELETNVLRDAYIAARCCLWVEYWRDGLSAAWLKLDINGQTLTSARPK